MLALFGIPLNGAYAQTINLETDDVTQEEINRRMEIVFDYLNEHTQREDFNGQSSLTLNIPVDEDVIVTAEVANQIDANFIANTVGSDTFSIAADTTYNYTLTITNVLGSGDQTVYKVNYTTGDANEYGNGVYKLTVNSVTITGTPTGLYEIGDIYTTIGSNNNIIVTTGGYIEYTHPTLSDITLQISPVDMGSLAGGTLIVNYTYDY